jgi:acetyltransferase
MAIRNLEKIFRPQSIAVVGASAVQGKVGNTVFRNLIESGFEGKLFPINPKCQAIEGVEVYSNLADLPMAVDLVIVCTPAQTVPKIVRECGEVGTRGIVILSAGFREMNDHGNRLEKVVLDEAKKFPGLRIIGPNCLGVISTSAKLNASFANGMPSNGRVAFVSQSGALCTAVLDWARQERIGFSHFVSVGNMLDVSFGDLIDYFEQDTTADAIILYVESINNAREFISAARAFSRKKPIIVCKSGRFEESAHAAASHTGAMAGVDAVYDAAFARAGMIRVFDIEEMFDCVELLAKKKSIGGARLAIVTNAGGPGVMATDALLELGGTLAKISSPTMLQLNHVLPEAWSRGNPIDILGDATPERLSATLDAVLADSEIDAALVVLSPQAMTDPLECAKALINTATKYHKPILTSWMGGISMHAGIELLNQASIPTYSTPERAIRAFMHLVEYHRLQKFLYEIPQDVGLNIEIDRVRVAKLMESAVTAERLILKESEAKELLELYGIPVAHAIVAKSSKEASQCARQIGFPVALKLVSPEITHKTDVGGVMLNVTSEDAVSEAFILIQNRAQKLRPDATFEGVSVQPMIADTAGRELILGATRDPVFGSVMLIGAGGIASELIKDRVLGFPPLNEVLARRMLESLRMWPLLQGYRGRAGIDVDRLVEVMMRLSYLISDNPQIVELDVNPLLATPDRSVALDARIILSPRVSDRASRRYSHLAIRPYPTEFTRNTKLQDHTDILLRPIKPEDEPLWKALIGRCSAETLHARFQYFFNVPSHDIASHFCFIDYDRELAIVAEIRSAQGTRQLIGVGRLVADVDHQNAELAILVGDPWQGKGLGSLLTDYCLEICKAWGICLITAETSPTNFRMLRVFERRGFDIKDHRDVVIARKTIESDPTLAITPN